MIGGKSLLAQLLDNQGKHASSSAAPLPASKHRKIQPCSTRAAVSAAADDSLGDSSSSSKKHVVATASDMFETHEEHERRHPRLEELKWSKTCNLDGHVLELVKVRQKHR